MPKATISNLSRPPDKRLRSQAGLPFRYLERDRQVIDELLRKALPDGSRRERLIANLEHLAFLRHASPGTREPAPKDVVGGLKKIADQAIALKETLQFARAGIAIVEWAQVKRQIRIAHAAFEIDNLEDVLEDLAAFARQGIAAIEKLPLSRKKPRGGPKVDVAAHRRALDVAKLLWEQTGTRPTVTTSVDGSGPTSLYGRLLLTHARAVLNKPRLPWSSIRHAAATAAKLYRAPYLDM